MAVGKGEEIFATAERLAAELEAAGLDVLLEAWRDVTEARPDRDLRLVLVGGVLGVMLWLGVTRGESPAEVSVRIEAIAPAADGYVVTLRAVNTGDTTAADVTVEGELRGASGVAVRVSYQL